MNSGKGMFLGWSPRPQKFPARCSWESLPQGDVTVIQSWGTLPPSLVARTVSSNKSLLSAPPPLNSLWN